MSDCGLVTALYIIAYIYKENTALNIITLLGPIAKITLLTNNDPIQHFGGGFKSALID